MSDVVQFVSRSDVEAKGNLKKFVSFAQHKLTALVDNGGWHDLIWDNDLVKVHFSKYRSRLEAKQHPPVPLAEPFGTFAKAYVRYQYSHRPTKSLIPMIKAIRMIERALIDKKTGRAELQNLTVAVLDKSVDNSRKFSASNSGKYQVGRHIEAIANFCREHYLVAALPDWKNPIKKEKDRTSVITQEGTRYRASRMPSNHSMLALADLFAQANDVESQYFTSIMVLMMVAPSRISEVLALPVDCIGWDTDSNGEKQMYLRWRAAKGGGPMKKWVPVTMQSVALKAIARLTEIGAAARTAAKFVHDNPGQFMRHSSCITPTVFDEDGPLDRSQVRAALGLKPLSGHPPRTTLPVSWAKMALKGLITYRMMADVIAKNFQGVYWPYINAEKEVLARDALCLVREFEYHKVYPVRPFSWTMASHNEINKRLGGREESSLFERAGMKNDDGSPIRLTTHQLRHWLSTMSVRGGMDDYTLARWAGRALIADNKYYDHRTQEERSTEAYALLRKEATTLEKFKGGLPVPYSELGVDRPGAAQATLYGMCTHDYAMAPCQKQTACMTCKEQVCIKGDHVTLERIKVLEAQTARLVDQGRKASSDGVFGADRWVDHQIWVLSHVRTMRMQLEAESVPDGAVLQIPKEYDPSPVRRSLMDQNLIETPSRTDIAAVTRVIPLIEGPEHA